MKKLLLLLLTSLSLSVNAHSKKTLMEKKPYTILVLMNATPKWLSLTRDERNNFFDKELVPIFSRLSKTINVKLFDSEYFHATISDFMVITTTSIEDYKLMIELIRGTKVYSVPYFEIKDIITGQENLFEDFNEQFKKEKK